MLSVGRKGEILGVECSPGPDLCSLLALDRRPERELSLALQRGRLGAQSSNDDHVAIEAKNLFAAKRRLVLGVRNALTLRCQ